MTLRACQRAGSATWRGPLACAAFAEVVPLIPSLPLRARWTALPPEAWGKAVRLALVLLLHGALGLAFLRLAPPALKEQMADAILFRTVAPETEEPVPAPAMVADDVTPMVSAPEVTLAPAPVEAAVPSVPVVVPVDMPPVEVPPLPDSRAIAPPAPPRPPARVYGPPDLRPPPPPDSERVEGSGPNGEPLYAARWYREPHDDELRGYLSTARGPGWGLIACRTVADYRVEDCVILGETPGSGYGRAVQAAAWQFRVRPPRIGGRDQVGEWVRIRVEARGGGR